MSLPDTSPVGTVTLACPLLCAWFPVLQGVIFPQYRVEQSPGKYLVPGIGTDRPSLIFEIRSLVPKCSGQEQELKQSGKMLLLYYRRDAVPQLN